MTRSLRPADPMETAEAASLYADLLGAVAHELGTLSSALTFRAMLLDAASPASDAGALHTLADDLAALMRTVRMAHGPLTHSMHADDIPGAIDAWWQTGSRLMHASLPRDVQVTTQFGVQAIDAHQGRVAAFLLWTGCKLLSIQATQPVREVRLHIDEEPSTSGTLVLTLSTANSQPLRHEPKRWAAFRVQLCRRGEARCVGWRASPTACQWTIRLRLQTVGPATRSAGRTTGA